MNLSAWLFTPVVLGANLILVQNVAIARSAVEIGAIAKSISLEIKSASNSRVGSGILLQRTGNVYTALTAAHVLTGSTAFTLKVSDGNVYQSLPGSVRQAGQNIDLAVVKFRSTKSYKLAKIGTTTALQLGAEIYVAGFPASTYAVAAGELNFTKGEVIGNATAANNKGYSLLYSNVTLPGMSGGPVLNAAGELVAIHGQGDREGGSGEGDKTGRNLGITVERLGAVAADLGVKVELAKLPGRQNLNAADYYLQGVTQYERNDLVGALIHFNRAIALNPKDAEAYNSRGNVKKRQNDLAGALADYNQAIALSPDYAIAYYNRGNIKKRQNDFTGASNDYGRALALNPRFAAAYYNRGNLRRKLNDQTGAIQDYRQAAAIYRKHGQTQRLQNVLKILQKMGATE
jgi:tetratricopeptide (TPR) repeat protein